MNQEDKFLELKRLLLEAEQTSLSQQSERIGELHAQLENFEKNQSQKTREELEKSFARFKEQFPSEYKGVITQAIEEQIQDSQDEMVNALYPIIGKMVKKFIVKEIEKVSEEIDRKINDDFSWEGVKRWFNKNFRGIDYGDQILKETVSVPLIEEVFLLDAESSILLGSYSNNNSMDADMLTAMLSAITDFVEDAFQSGEQNLEWLEYETHKIHVQKQGKVGIAFVISGNPHAEFKSELQEGIFTFMEDFNLDISEEEHNERLKLHFEKFMQEQK